jgi:hypothetical protein
MGPIGPMIMEGTCRPRSSALIRKRIFQEITASLALRPSWDGFEITFLRSSGDGLFCPEPGARDGKLRYQCLTPAPSLPRHSIYWAAMRVWKRF